MKTSNYIVFLLIASFVMPLNAAVILTRDNRDYGDFASPASLVDIDKTTHFGFEAELISDIDELDFLMDPVSAFEDSVEVVADYLASQDIDFFNRSSVSFYVRWRRTFHCRSEGLFPEQIPFKDIWSE